MFNTRPLSQRDPAWKNVALGFPDEGQTIGAYGCTLTCVTMIANGFGYTETPATLNEKLRNLGPGQGFVESLIAWFGIPRVLPGLQLNRLIDCRKVAAPMALIDTTLAAGKPVLVELDHSPDSGFQNHWVVIYDKQGNDYLIRDPWPIPTEKSASLMERYGFAGTAAQVITYVVLLDNPNFAPTPAPVPTPTTVTIVVNNTPDIVAAGGLALRNQPTAAGSSILRRLAAGTQVTSLETATAVSAKLGVYNQWLNVKTADGVTGWCAAWLVTARMPTSATPALPTLPAKGKRGPIELDVASAVQPPLRDEVLVMVKKTLKNAIVRSQPLVGGRIVARVKGGTQLQAIETRAALEKRMGNKKRGQWVRVVVNTAIAKGTPVERVAGYIAESNLELLPPPAKKRRISTRGLPKDVGITGVVEPDARPVLRVVSDVGLNLRSGPSTSASRITTLPFGTQILSREPLAGIQPKIGVAGSWIAVSTIGGVDGFVTGEFVVVEGAPPTTPAIDPDVLAQGCVFAALNTPLFNGANGGGGSDWTVTAGTPLILLNTNDWSGVGTGSGFIKVRTYAFKEGFVRATALRAPELPDRRSRVIDEPLPLGMSAWNYGLHDPFDRNLFSGSNKRGWVLFTHRLTDAPGNNYEDWSKNNWGVIARLNNDYGGNGTVPTPDKYDAFAEGCRRWVSNSKGNVIWVIGNEMNNPREWPGSGSDPSKAITPENYAACFNKVRAAIKSVQPNAIVVPGSIDPFQGPQQSCLEYWNRMMAAITDLDGVSLHCYTNGPTPDLVTSLKRFDNDPLRWQYFHFRAFTTFMDVMPARFRTKPVFITETDAHSGTPWSGGQNGWVQAAYGEINRWNMQPQVQQILSLVLYRWSRDDVYSIVDKPAIQNDIRATVNSTDYRWRA